MHYIIALAVFISGLSFGAPHKHALGLRRDVMKHKEFLLHAEKSIPAEATIPGMVDLTPRVSPPEDQRQCGACWSFGITKALRSALMLTGHDPGRLAFNYLLNNCGGVVSEYGCQGGDFRAGQNMLNGRGPWLESADPYTATDRGQCLGLAPRGTALSYKVVGPGTRPPTFQELATAISQQHMLVIDVCVGNQWEAYTGGIFNRNECGPSGINHMINLTKFSCESSVDSNGNCVFNSAGKPANGDGWLGVENNWGTSWGESGFMRTRWGVNAVADTAMYFVVNSPTPPGPGPVPPPPTPSCHGWMCKMFNCRFPWCQ